MKFCFRLQLRKRNQLKKFVKSSSPSVDLFHSYDHNHHRNVFVNESNNMSLTNESGGGGAGGDDRLFIPTPVDEQQIANAQEKVDRLINIISETYEKTLVRNLHLEDLDMRSSDLFRDAEKMKNMAHKMQDKFFWEDSKCHLSLSLSIEFFSLDLCISEYYLILTLASLSAIVLGGLLALIFIPKLTSS